MFCSVIDSKKAMTDGFQRPGHKIENFSTFQINEVYRARPLSLAFFLFLAADGDLKGLNSYIVHLSLRCCIHGVIRPFAFLGGSGVNGYFSKLHV